ncbi:hypothetical protein H8A97_36980 [Bradyrhizobium sp. Arg62]|nr:hypothetical protein [Bradyrhizobium ivorense]MCC8950514.1 hypothetical protein [Bradyrhizobium brasilense]
MDFTSTRGGLRQSDGAGPQENLSVSPSADAAAFEQQLRETANAGGGVPMQASIYQVGASLPEGQPLREAGAHEYTPIPLRVRSFTAASRARIRSRIALMRSVRGPDLRQLAGAEQPGKLLGIPAVCFDPITGLAWNQGRGNDSTSMAKCFDLSLQPISRRPSLIAKS